MEIEEKKYYSFGTAYYQETEQILGRPLTEDEKYVVRIVADLVARDLY